MIYQGKRIYRCIDHQLEKGDIGYIEEIDIPDTIVNVAFLLSDVVMWRVHINTIVPFKNKEQQLSVNFKYSPDIIIIENYDAFTKLMHEFESSRFIQFREG